MILRGTAICNQLCEIFGMLQTSEQHLESTTAVWLLVSQWKQGKKKEGAGIKAPLEQKTRSKWHHQWILGNLQKRPNMLPTYSLLNAAERNTLKHILWDQYHSDPQTKKRTAHIQKKTYFTVKITNKILARWLQQIRRIIHHDHMEFILVI